MKAPTSLFVDKVGMSALRQIVGNKIVVSIDRGRVRDNAVYFDKALIEYWPHDGRRRSRSNFAVPVTGVFESVGDEFLDQVCDFPTDQSAWTQEETSQWTHLVACARYI